VVPSSYHSPTIAGSLVFLPIERAFAPCSGVQVAFTSEEEEIIIVAHVEDMVSKMVDMMSRMLVVGRALETKLKKN